MYVFFAVLRALCMSIIIVCDTNFTIPEHLKKRDLKKTLWWKSFQDNIFPKILQSFFQSSIENHDGRLFQKSLGGQETNFQKEGVQVGLGKRF